MNDDYAQCANCEVEWYIDDMLFDEMVEQYYCNRECFDEWHDENPEVVGDYYVSMNVY